MIIQAKYILINPKIKQEWAEAAKIDPTRLVEVNINEL